MLHKFISFFSKEEPIEKPWNVLLKFSDEEDLVTFVADHNWTILKLKQSISRQRNIPVSQQKIVYKAKPLSDDQILSNIPNLVELSLLVIWNTKLPKEIKPPKSDPYQDAANWRDEMLPLNKIKKPSSDRLPIIIFFPGTFCPIHAGHIHTLQVAKTYIESLGIYEVIGGYISPCADSYAVKKLKEKRYNKCQSVNNNRKRVSTRHRVRLCQLAAECFDWLMVDQLQIANRRNLATFDIVTMHKEISARVPFLRNGNFFMLWVSGVDLMSYPLSSDIAHCTTTLTVINRSGYDEHLKITKESGVMFVETENVDLSSTEMRKAIQNKESISKFYSDFATMWPSAIQVENYLHRHRLWADPWRSLSLDIEELPLHPKLVNATTLTNALKLNGFIDQNIQVESFKMERIGYGKGFRSETYRIHSIVYDSAATKSLSSVVYKYLDLSSYKKIEMEWNFCRAEKGFYENISHLFSIPQMPLCYYTHLDEEKKQTSLLIEDLSKCVNNFTFLQGVPPAIIMEMVRHLAEFHAYFWGGSFFEKNSDKLPWVKSLASEEFIDWANSRFVRMLSWGEVKEYNKQTAPSTCKLLEELPKMLPNIMKHLGTKNVTFIHGDAWINNWMFEDNKKPVLIDWQTCCIGSGLYDLATVLISCASYWYKLLCCYEYYKVLKEHGVTDYTRVECEYDFKQAKLFALVVTFPVTRRVFMKPFDQDPEAPNIMAKYKMVENFLKSVCE